MLERDKTAEQPMRELTTPMEAVSLLKAIMKKAEVLFEAQSVGLYLLCTDTAGQSILQLVTSSSEEPTGRALKKGEGMAWQLLTGTEFYLQTFDYDTYEYRTGHEGAFEAILEVPLLKQEDRIGVLYLTDARGRPFKEYDAELLRVFADAVVRVIERCDLARMKELVSGSTEVSQLNKPDPAIGSGVLPESESNARPAGDPIAKSLLPSIGRKLGLPRRVKSDSDLVALVEKRLPVAAISALMEHGLLEKEIYSVIVPRRTLQHRRARKERLSREESDRAVRLARLAALNERVFGDREAGMHWLRSPKKRFHGRTPMAMMETEAGSRLVEEALHQIDEGMAA